MRTHYTMTRYIVHIERSIFELGEKEVCKMFRKQKNFTQINYF